MQYTEYFWYFTFVFLEIIYHLTLKTLKEHVYPRVGEKWQNRGKHRSNASTLYIRENLSPDTKDHGWNQAWLVSRGPTTDFLQVSEKLSHMEPLVLTKAQSSAGSVGLLPLRAVQHRDKLQPGSGATLHGSLWSVSRDPMGKPPSVLLRHICWHWCPRFLSPNSYSAPLICSPGLSSLPNVSVCNGFYTSHLF